MSPRRRSSSAGPQDFLLEIGCEELPAEYLPEVMAALRAHATGALGSDKGFVSQGIEVFATPRRLALVVPGLAPVVRWEKIGPSKSAAFDAAGKPTGAAQGFAKSQGISVEALIVKDTLRGPCVVAVHEAPIVEKLAEAIPVLVRLLRFPKQMRWEASGTTFARPIRWLVALYGSSVVPCRIADVTSGRASRGLRRDGARSLEIPAAANYRAILQKSGIQLEWCEKKSGSPIDDEPKEGSSEAAWPKRMKLLEVLAAAARAAGGHLETGPAFEELLTTVSFLAESPVVQAGSFKRSYLTLPSDVLSTAMATHMKAFGVYDAAGKLLPTFLVVLEGHPSTPGVVMANYERILEARFTDAQFFWGEDTKSSLESKCTQLSGLVFHKSLGTLDQKLARMGQVAKVLGQTSPALARALRLSKADLVTQMVKEFPMLQGAIGAEYARADGEPADVVAALREQYAPRTAGDPIPASATGAWLAVLDRVDTLTGYFGVGLAPTSSEDPYGLRRQALGLVRILVEKPLAISLDTLWKSAIESWGSVLKLPASETQGQLASFILDRFQWWACQQRGYSRALFDALVAASTDNLADAADRLNQLNHMWQDERCRVEQLYPAGKVVERTGRIVASAPRKDSLGDVDPTLFVVPEERVLWESWQHVKQPISKLIDQKSYREATVMYGSLSAPLGRFFEKVYVMDDNLPVRQNRLTLLYDIHKLYATGVADLSKLLLPKEL